MNLHLHIERLVLEGLPFATSQPAEIEAALGSELARLFGERGPEVVSGGAVPKLSAAPIQLSHGTGGAELGRKIARSLHGGLVPSRPAAREPSRQGPSR
jgi:hypothetical protein